MAPQVHQGSAAQILAEIIGSRADLSESTTKGEFPSVNLERKANCGNMAIGSNDSEFDVLLIP